ncbi:MAG: branched-chain amino acid aminotransferase [Verrucomicrobiae bacterium]|nr:branched-chain amino acid aminotransferase [Verrucomicrobiae bacterium]
MQCFAFLNGQFIPEEQAAVSIFDRGFLYGDGLFETVCIYNGKVFRLNRHLERLFGGLDTLRFKIPYGQSAMALSLTELIRHNNITNGFARIILTRGVSDFGLGTKSSRDPVVVMYAQSRERFSDERYARGFRVIIARERANAQSVMEVTKTISRVHHVLAKMEAEDKGVDDAILVNTNGHLAEGTASNLFLVKGGALLTAPIEAGLLPGITREIIQTLANSERVPIKEGHYTAQDFYSADEAFLSSTLMELMPVVEVDGKKVGKGEPGPVTRKLHAAYRTLVVEELGL